MQSSRAAWKRLRRSERVQALTLPLFAGAERTRTRRHRSRAGCGEFPSRSLNTSRSTNPHQPYDLPDRYLQRLGLSRTWLERVLAAGAVKECALFLPDLFLIDG